MGMDFLMSINIFHGYRFETTKPNGFVTVAISSRAGVPRVTIRRPGIRAVERRALLNYSHNSANLSRQKVLYSFDCICLGNYLRGIIDGVKLRHQQASMIYVIDKQNTNVSQVKPA
jgi:hypothetical protein